MSYKYVVDSSAWMEYIGGTEAGASFKDIIESEVIACSVVAIAELADRFHRDGQPFERTLHFILGRAAILPVTIPICLLAARKKKEIRARNTKFGLADALHLATALDEKAILLTTDGDFLGVDGVYFVPVRKQE